ncbi:MAG: hypothetical protein AB7G08_31890 [Hyphomicrobiaceae bacterium]
MFASLPPTHAEWIDHHRQVLAVLEQARAEGTLSPEDIADIEARHIELMAKHGIDLKPTTKRKYRRRGHARWDGVPPGGVARAEATAKRRIRTEKWGGAVGTFLERVQSPFAPDCAAIDTCQKAIKALYDCKRSTPEVALALGLTLASARVGVSRVRHGRRR